MSNYRTRNRLVLAGVQAAVGTEEALTPGANAIRVRDVQPSSNFDTLDPDEVGGALDPAGQPLVGGGNVGFELGAYMKGAGTAGNAPDYGPLMIGCAMQEKLTATAITGTAQGGDATTIQLAAGESSTDGEYVGMPVRITSGTGSGQGWRVITAYDGATQTATIYPDWATPPDATSEYEVPANALYRPASADLKVLSIFDYQRSSASGGQAWQRKAIDAAGTFTAEVTTRGFGSLTFNFTGRLPSNPANVADPGEGTFNATRARPFINADAYLGGAPVKFRTVSFDYGANVQQSDDPAALFGYGAAGVTSRNVTGQINPILELASVRNIFADFIAGTKKPLWVRWGETAGNRISILAPEIVYTGEEPGDQDGFAIQTAPFAATGLDSGMFYCVF